MRRALFAAFGALVIAAVIAGCATDPDLRWAQAQQAYNSAGALFNDLRRPCVDIGPDDPGCIIDDEAYLLLDPILDQARAALDRYEETGSVDWLDVATGFVEEFQVEIIKVIQ